MRWRGGGFTIVELLVTLMVMSIIAAAALPMAEIAHRRERERSLKQALREIRSAIDAYKAAADAGRIPSAAGTTGYPPNLEVLARGLPDADGRIVYFLRRVPRDPFAAISSTADGGWGLRSYASPPSAPSPGVDVFDVYSRSDYVGLDGRPVSQW